MSNLQDFSKLINDLRDDSALDDFREEEYRGAFTEFCRGIASRMRAIGSRTDREAHARR